MEIPHFKYHPNPVGSGVFEKYDGTCPCCERKRGWGYVGPFYCYEDIENLCPWCISDGSAAEKYNGTFVDDPGPEKLPDQSIFETLIKRTPGYFSAQGDPWPVHCDDYCSLVGKTNWKELEPLIFNLQYDVEETMKNNGLSYQEMINELSRENSPLWAHLFKCLHCGSYRLVADYE